MNWLIVAVIAVVVLLTVLVKSFSRHGGRIVRHPYQKQTNLFSPDDRVFHRALRMAVSEDYEIFGKIRVADIVLPKKNASRNDARLAFNPIAGRHFDFVLCDKKSLAVVCAIQLHDKTNPARQTEQDDPLKSICEAISLPFVVFHIKADYPPEEIRDKLLKALTQEPFYLIETDGRKEPRISNIEDMKF